MRPSPLLLRNVQQVTRLLRDDVGVGRPRTCIRCNRELASVRARYETNGFGFLECPGCRAAILFLKAG